MSRTCYLHIGLSKTGSTSIQLTCQQNKAALRSAGYLYPTAEINHMQLNTYFSEDLVRPRRNAHRGVQEADLRDGATAFFADFQADVAAAPELDIVVSGEGFANMKSPVLEKVVAFCGTLAPRVVAIAYVRHPFDWVVSASQQLVKVGKRTEAQLDLLRGRPRFAKWLGRVKGHFAEDCFLVRPFARDQLIDGDVTVDFLRTIGMMPEAIAGLEISKANSSLSYEGFLLASALAAALPEEDGKMRTDRANAMDHILEKIRGAKFGVSAEVMAQAEEVYAEDIAALEAQFGLRFSGPQTAVSAPVWGPDTLTDIVERMNRIQIEHEHYRLMIAKLKAELAAKG